MLRGVLKGGGLAHPGSVKSMVPTFSIFFGPNSVSSGLFQLYRADFYPALSQAVHVQLYSYFVSQTGAGCTPSTPNE